jgi:hypothetical protein
MNGEGFPWGRVISYAIWILGLAVILADFSIYNFLAQKRGLKWKQIIRKNSFLRPVHLGLILVAAGLAGSLHSPFLGGLMGAGAFLLVLSFVSDNEYIKRMWKRKFRVKK